jgi:hypothetical protein
MIGRRHWITISILPIAGYAFVLNDWRVIDRIRAKAPTTQSAVAGNRN